MKNIHNTIALALLLLATNSSAISNGGGRRLACKTQKLQCGKQEWCLDDESGEWVKVGGIYDDENCDGGGDTASKMGGCKMQNLKCGKQEWCLDESSGDWVKVGDVYDSENCDAAGEMTGAGTWTSETIVFDTLERSYLVYKPTAVGFAPGNYTGLMLFLHGLGGSSNVHKYYDVATHADKYGFIGLIPDGSPWSSDESQEKEEDGWDGPEDDNENNGEGCEYYLYLEECYEVCGDGNKPIVAIEKCEGKVELVTVKNKDGNNERKLQGTYHWNMDDPTGVDEVSYLKHIVQKESEAHLIAAGLPRIALGFSNGAGVASLLGCHDSFDLWVAHVAVPIEMDAGFPSTCTTVKGLKSESKGGKMLLLRQRHLEIENSPQTSWSAVGENDFFIASLEPTPVEGVKSQFMMRHSKSDCLEEDWVETSGEDYVCFCYPNCVEVGELCVYDDIGHDIKPSMTENAWLYISSVWGTPEDGQSESPIADDETDPIHETTSPPTKESSTSTNGPANATSETANISPTSTNNSSDKPSPSSSGQLVMNPERCNIILALGLLWLLLSLL